MTASDLRDGSLTTAHLRDGTLERSDFAGPLPAGPGGPAGAPGPAGETAIVDRRAADLLLKLRDTRTAIASCVPGEVAVGGGAAHSGTKDEFVSIILSEPVAADGTPLDDGEPATGWRAIGASTIFAAGDVTMRVHVLCARP